MAKKTAAVAEAAPEITLPDSKVNVVSNPNTDEFFDLDALDLDVIEWCKRRIEYIYGVQQAPQWAELTNTQRLFLIACITTCCELSGEPVPPKSHAFSSISKALGDRTPVGMLGRLADPSGLAHRRKRARNNPLYGMAVGENQSALEKAVAEELPGIMRQG